MFEAKTVFILGAGASAEVGLPVGNGLLREICDLLNFRFDFGIQKSGCDIILQALRDELVIEKSVSKLNEHIQAAFQVLRSADQALSIDHIVDALEDERVEKVAKLAIVRAIQLAEEKSKYFLRREAGDSDIDVKIFHGTWYDSFTKALCEKRRRSDLERIFDNVSIVSFNYDRCIERYLPSSIAQYYGVPVSRVRDLMGRLKVVRPYGIAGHLSWMEEARIRSQTLGSSSAKRLASDSALIRTFTQGVADGNIASEITNVIGNAERVVFLGFAFHPQNMAVLRAKVNQNTEVIATAHSASDNDKFVIRDSIIKTFSYRSDRPMSIQISNEKCNGLFQSYWRTMTAPPIENYRELLENVRRL